MSKARMEIDQLDCLEEYINFLKTFYFLQFPFMYHLQ